MLCKICKAISLRAFKAKVLGKYDAVYYVCTSCGFMQTEEPFWLSESYASAINEIDLGPVNRAITGSRLVEGLILSLFNKKSKFIDYGAGYGIFVRMMRDKGFDFYWHDLYCENLFAKHFIAHTDERFEMLTAFEVFEHLVDPLSEIEKMLDRADNIIFSTLLIPRKVNNIEDWWYVAPEHGQHIAFYTLKAIAFTAKNFNLYMASDGIGFHILSRKKVSSQLLRFFTRDDFKSNFVRRVLRTRMKRKSLLLDDFKQVSGHTIQ